jgi:hypothetical protein
MKRFAAVALAVIFVASLGVSQDQTIVIKEFSRTGYMSGMKLSFVILIDKTIDVFFSGPGKDTIKAKADAGTTFFISGTADKAFKLSTKFVVEQDEEKLTGSITSLQNFVDGDVAKGQKISGLLQLDKKLNLAHPFTIRGSNFVLDFKLSYDAQRMVTK